MARDSLLDEGQQEERIADASEEEDRIADASEEIAIPEAPSTPTPVATIPEVPRIATAEERLAELQGEFLAAIDDARRALEAAEDARDNARLRLRKSVQDATKVFPANENGRLADAAGISVSTVSTWAPRSKRGPKKPKVAETTERPAEKV